MDDPLFLLRPSLTKSIAIVCSTTTTTKQQTTFVFRLSHITKTKYTDNSIGNRALYSGQVEDQYHLLYTISPCIHLCFLLIRIYELILEGFDKNVISL